MPDIALFFIVMLVIATVLAIVGSGDIIAGVVGGAIIAVLVTAMVALTIWFLGGWDAVFTHNWAKWFEERHG